MEIVRSQNARSISEFYPVEIFHEGAIFEIFWKIWFFWKNAKDNAPALRVLAREPGWRFTARCHDVGREYFNLIDTLYFSY